MSALLSVPGIPPGSTFNAPLAVADVFLAVADFSRAAAKVDRIADPLKRRKGWELLADYAEVLYAQATAGIAQLDSQPQPEQEGGVA